MAALLAAGLVGNAMFGITMPAAVPTTDANPGTLFPYFVPFTGSAVIAVLLAWRKPGNPVGWLLGTVIASFLLSGIAQDYLFHWLYLPDLPEGPLVTLFLVSTALSGATPISLVLLTLVFPDGRLLSRRWRVVVWLTVAYGLFGLPSLVDPALIGDGQRQVANPLAVAGSHDVLSVFSGIGTFLWLALMASALVSLGLRYRRATSDLRHQVKWFLLGTAMVVVGILVATVTATSSTWSTPAPIVASTIGFSALPLSLGIAVLKYRLYDIDVVISRALVYGALAAFITAVYVAIVVGIGSLVGAGGRPNLVLSIIATAVVAVGFQPVRERVQRIANRLVYGRRATPYEVLAEFSERVAESYAGDEVLARMARLLQEGTAAEAATVWLRSAGQLMPSATSPDTVVGFEPLAMANGALPDIPNTSRAIPVRHGDEILGALTVVKRRGEALTPIEEKLLTDLAHQAGLVLKNVGLTADLQARLEELRASRQRLVSAQDQERRRLERNLHDGAQQHLVALKVKLGLAEVLATKDPAKAQATIGELKSDADEALETLRDLARGIYPPLLADRGLVVALEGQARKASIPVSVRAEGVDRYPADIEAAVYFCTLEALQNVQKYAAATEAVVRLAVSDGRLRVDISDDGKGFDVATAPPGSGLTNIGDRVSAIGGHLQVESKPGAGTTLRIEIPVPAGVAPAT
jgi:signal transduction histidine kinase